jgi:hypothetical protein
MILGFEGIDMMLQLPDFIFNWHGEVCPVG